MTACVGAFRGPYSRRNTPLLSTDILRCFHPSQLCLAPSMLFVRNHRFTASMCQVTSFEPQYLHLSIGLLLGPVLLWYFLMQHATGTRLIVRPKGVVVAILVRSTVREVHPVTLNHLWPFALAQWFAPWPLLVVVPLLDPPPSFLAALGAFRLSFVLVRVNSTYTSVPTTRIAAPYRIRCHY